MLQKIPNDNDDILFLIQQQQDNFPTLKEVIKKLDISPSTLLLPQSVNSISSVIDSNILIIIESITFLDIIKLYSFKIYGEPELFVKNIKSLIISNRTYKNNTNSKKILNIDIVSDFIYSSEESLDEFLDNNKVFLALYIFSLLNTILYQE